MALSKYTPVAAAVRTPGLAQELRNIQLSIDSIVNMLKALNVAVEVGPPDSAGVGYRTLRIPN